jgi:RNA polymerase sigma factor (sigma-70 family)
MAKGTEGSLIERLRQALLPGDGGDLSDGELLECFLTHREEAAFAALVRRHGPMVLGVCRRILTDLHDAEDAFQATFLVLARKADSVHPRDLVGAWLHGVACRTACKVRSLNARRRAAVTPAGELPERPAPAEAPPSDLGQLLDRELQHLPEKYRTPIVLCDLQEKARPAAARQLNVPEGTLSSRLARGRAMLRKRLVRCGLAPAAGVAVLPAQGATAAVPEPLLTSTLNLTAALAAGETTSAPARAVVLAEGVLRTMLLARIKFTLAVVLAVAGLAVSVGLLAHHLASAAETPRAPQAPRGGGQAQGKKPPAGDALLAAGREALKTVEAFLAAGFAGKAEEAAALADRNTSVGRHAAEFKLVLGVERLRLVKFYVGEKGARQGGLAITEDVRLRERKGPRVGPMVLTLIKQGGGPWLVKDIDFESAESVKDEVKRFKGRYPDSREVPLPAVKPKPPLEEKRPAQDARQTAAAFLGEFAVGRLAEAGLLRDPGFVEADDLKAVRASMTAEKLPLASVHGTPEKAVAVTGEVTAKAGSALVQGRILLGLTRQGESWRITGFAFLPDAGALEARARFLREHGDAKAVP